MMQGPRIVSKSCSLQRNPLVGGNFLGPQDQTSDHRVFCHHDQNPGTHGLLFFLCRYHSKNASLFCGREKYISTHKEAVVQLTPLQAKCAFIHRHCHSVQRTFVCIFHFLSLSNNGGCALQLHISPIYPIFQVCGGLSAQVRMHARSLESTPTSMQAGFCLWQFRS